MPQAVHGLRYLPDILQLTATQHQAPRSGCLGVQDEEEVEEGEYVYCNLAAEILKHQFYKAVCSNEAVAFYAPLCVTPLARHPHVLFWPPGS